MELNQLLEKLLSACISTEISRAYIVFSLEELLSWLDKPINNTDSNCQIIDRFISYNILTNKKIENLPEDIKEILFDMGATLHDTHTNPEIAENFESTPQQLLDRVQKLPIDP